MPNERNKIHKCSHHNPATNDSWWRNFHFSGKVIMCSVLFGLGLVLVGGLLFVIGNDQKEDPDPENLKKSEMENKAPLTILGPVIMGIGSFTVIVGIIMCLFETNLCWKRQPDSRPLIEEQTSNAAAQSTDPAVVPSTSQRREKHRHHKKSSSPRKHKRTSKTTDNTGFESSPSSKPIDMQRSSSRDLTSSDKFVTPPSSFAAGNAGPSTNYSDPENQTSGSLMKSFLSSGKSWTTSTEFQTPSSSLQDSCGSFEIRKAEVEIPPEVSNTKKPVSKNIDSLQHEFLTPKNSSSEIIDEESESEESEVKVINSDSKSEKPSSVTDFDQENLDISRHDFVTPQNSYIDNKEFPVKVIEKEMNDDSSISENPHFADIKTTGDSVLPVAITEKAELISSQEGNTCENVSISSPPTETEDLQSHNRKGVAMENTVQTKPIDSVTQVCDTKEENSKTILNHFTIKDHANVKNLSTTQESNLVNSKELDPRMGNLTENVNQHEFTEKLESISSDVLTENIASPSDNTEGTIRNVVTVSPHSNEALKEVIIDDSSPMTSNEVRDQTSSTNLLHE